jgi:hypothetical protein
MYRENSGLKEGLIVLRTAWLKIVILAVDLKHRKNLIIKYQVLIANIQTRNVFS